MEAVSAALEVPLILGGAGPEVMDPKLIDPKLIDRDYLSAKGVRVCLQGHQPFMAAVKAVHDTLKALRDGTPPTEIENLPPKELMKRVTRDADYRRWMNDFLGGG